MAFSPFTSLRSPTTRRQSPPTIPTTTLPHRSPGRVSVASASNDGKGRYARRETHLLAEEDDFPGTIPRTVWLPHEYLTGTIQGQVIVLVCGAIVLVFSGAVTWKFAGTKNELYDNSWSQSFWFAWGMFFDPGTEMGFEASDTHWNKTLAASFSVLGFLYNLLLLGLLVEQARLILTLNYRRGNRIVANGHTLLLGWNENVLFMLNEFVHAAAARNAKERFVILADQDQEFMTQRIDYNFPSKEHLKGQKVSVFSGHPCERNDLTKVSAKSAREIICLGNGTTSPRTSDQETTQIIVALASLPDEPYGNIIASISKPDAAPVVDAIMERAEGVVAKDLINRMMCLKALRPTVGRCCELFATFLHGETLSCRTLSDLGLDPSECRTFGAAHQGLKQGIAVGIKHPRPRNGGSGMMKVSIAPQDGAAIAREDELLVLTNTTGPRKESLDKYAAAFEAGGKIIIAGWPYNMLDIIEALNMYLDRKTELHIIANMDESRQKQELGYHPDSAKMIQKVVHHCGSRAQSKDLQKLPLEQARLILVLADYEDEDANTSDSACLACAITLADMVCKPPRPPHLICELHANRTARMLNNNPELKNRADFFHTNAVESGLIATASASRAVYNCLGMLIEPDGSNLFCRLLRDHISCNSEASLRAAVRGGGLDGATFNQLARMARSKDELLIGYRKVSGEEEELVLQPSECDEDLGLQSQDELILIRGCGVA